MKGFAEKDQQVPMPSGVWHRGGWVERLRAGWSSQSAALHTLTSLGPFPSGLSLSSTGKLL